MKNVIVAGMMATLIISCATDSQITGSWKSNTRTKSYSNVVVAALTHDVHAKTVVETDLTASLRDRGLMASKSLDIFPPNFSKDILKEEMLSKMRYTGADAIITVTLIDKESKPQYIPGSSGFISPGFTGYYMAMYPTVYTPGYYVENRVYYMETNLYDAQTEELIWSARSETYNPEDISGFSIAMANKITSKLHRDKIITPFQKHRVAIPPKKTASRLPLINTFGFTYQ